MVEIKWFMIQVPRRRDEEHYAGKKGLKIVFFPVSRHHDHPVEYHSSHAFWSSFTFDLQFCQFSCILKNKKHLSVNQTQIQFLLRLLMARTTLSATGCSFLQNLISFWSNFRHSRLFQLRQIVTFQVWQSRQFILVLYNMFDLIFFLLLMLNLAWQVLENKRLDLDACKNKVRKARSLQMQPPVSFRSTFYWQADLNEVGFVFVFLLSEYT